MRKRISSSSADARPRAVLGFGGAAIGNLFEPLSDDDAAATVEAVWDAGIRVFDTAPHYGVGLSEERLGRSLRTKPRDAFELSTKVGRLLTDGPEPGDGEGFSQVPHRARHWDFSADGVRRSIDDSLIRLGLDRIDTVFVHDPDEHEDDAAAGAIPALIVLRDQGVIGRVGVGMNQWEMPLRFVERFDLDVVLLAGRWTLLDRSGEPLLHVCAERDVAVWIGGPFNSGLLAGGSTYNYETATADVMERAANLDATCAADGVPLLAAALQFPARHPAVEVVLTGMRSAAEAAANTTAFAADIPEALWDALG
jgi:D-threo-aldose 1-dehydrogenase